MLTLADNFRLFVIVAVARNYREAIVILTYRDRVNVQLRVARALADNLDIRFRAVKLKAVHQAEFLPLAADKLNISVLKVQRQAQRFVGRKLPVANARAVCACFLIGESVIFANAELINLAVVEVRVAAALRKCVGHDANQQRIESLAAELVFGVGLIKTHAVAQQIMHQLCYVGFVEIARTLIVCAVRVELSLAVNVVYNFAVIGDCRILLPHVVAADLGDMLLGRRFVRLHCCGQKRQQPRFSLRLQ